VTVPQSLLVVALALAWLVVLVPSSSRRRKRVPEIVDGNGFRVLRRSAVKRPRLNRRRDSSNLPPVSTVNFDSEGQMSSQSSDVEHHETADDTVVLESNDGVENDPTIQLEPIDDEMTAAEAGYDQSEITAGHDAGREAADDEAELRAQYQAWRAATRSAETAEDQPAPEDVRPIPRRPGRGTYDPEAAERARQYKYARRRRSLMVLLVITAAFTVTAVTVSPNFWIGVGITVALLAVFMTYLRRQVRIEADIRERRLAKLQRARQIRPERPRAAAAADDPYAQRAPRPRQAPGPVHHRTNRVVVDLDDDDPGFDDLEQYEPMEYRRAVGQ
jgi:hypothetical protein